MPKAANIIPVATVSGPVLTDLTGRRLALISTGCASQKFYWRRLPVQLVVLARHALCMKTSWLTRTLLGRSYQLLAGFLQLTASPQ